MNEKKIQVADEFRALQGLACSDADQEKRTVTLTGSSELAVSRFDWEKCEEYDEVLSHDPADVDLSRMNDGGPVLDRHRGDQIAVVESCEVRDGKTHFRIRFSEATERGRVIFADVVAGIRRNVSVGYQKTDVINSERQPNGRLLVRFKWQPYELSFEPVPADPHVGVGRSRPESVQELTLPEEPGSNKKRATIILN